MAQGGRRGVQGASGVEHLTMPIVLVHIPVGTHQEGVGDIQGGHLKLGVQLGEEVEGATVYILPCHVFIGQDNAIALARSDGTYSSHQL